MDLHPKRFHGTFLRTGDAAIYRYDGKIEPTVGGSAWFATVRLDGEICGRPNGVLTHPRFTDAAIEAAVRGLVEASIRDRVGVR